MVRNIFMDSGSVALNSKKPTCSLNMNSQLIVFKQFGKMVPAKLSVELGNPYGRVKYFMKCW